LRRAAAAWLAAALVAAAAPPALAHSLLLEASPAPDAVLTLSPDRVTLRFNNRIEKMLSRLTLVGERGQTQPLAVTPGGPPDQLGAPLPFLDPGRWRLDWSVLSTDGHLVSGGYSFRIGP
jgi:methionine-rich copper-binding protein CopC